MGISACAVPKRLHHGDISCLENEGRRILNLIRRMKTLLQATRLLPQRQSEALPCQDDVLFRPGMDLVAVGTGYLLGFDFSGGPELFLYRLAGRREFRRRLAPDEEAFNNWSSWFRRGAGHKELHSW